MISDKYRNFSLNELYAEPLVTPPDVGSKWAGVRHGDLAVAVKQELENRRYVPLKFSCHVWYNGLKVSASLAVEPPKIAHPGIRYAVGWNSSNNSDQVVAFYLGGIFQKVPFVVDRWKGSRYTTNFDLAGEIRVACDTWENQLDDVPFFRKRMADTQVHSWPVLFLAVGRRKLLPWSKMGKFDAEFRKGGGKTLWDVQAAFSRINGLTSAPKQMDNLYGFHQLAKKLLESKGVPT